MKVFTYGKAMKILLSIACIFLLVMCVLCIGAFLYEMKHPLLSVVLSIMMLALGGLSVYGLADLQSTITVDAYGIKYQSKLRQRELLWQDIREVKQLNDGVSVKGLHGKKPIKISHYLQHYQELLNLIYRRETLPVPQVVDKIAQEQAAALEGLDHATAARKVRLSKMLVIGTNIAAGVIVAAHVFLGASRYFPFLPVILFSLLLIMIYLMYHFKGILGLDEKREERWRSGFTPFLIINVSLFFMTLGLHVLDLGLLWTIAGGLALFLTLMLYLAIRKFPVEPKRKASYNALYGILMLAGSYSIVLYTNNTFDTTSPERYATRVLNMRIYNGKSTTYYVEVSGWPGKAAGEIDVQKALFYNVEIGDELDALVYKGYWGIPWYTLSAR